MDRDEQERLGELEDARAGGDVLEGDDEPRPEEATTGGPGLTGLTPPD